MGGSNRECKKFLFAFIPKISIGTDPTNEVSIDFDWEEVKRNPDEVLNLAEKISRKKGLKIVICVDEFQNIAEFTDPDYFQEKVAFTLVAAPKCSLLSLWQQAPHDDGSAY